MLILAGTAISISINGGNIFARTNDAAEKWNTAVLAEEEATENVLSYIELKIPAELKVGDTVKWEPSGHYEWNVEYYADSTTLNSSSMTKMLYSGIEVPNEAVPAWQEGSTRIDDINMSINSWKVLKVDKDGKKVTLVPEEPTQSIVRLLGVQGYNNGVKLLNDVCNALYGGTQVGIEARSINMADIESLIDEVPEYKTKHTDNVGYESYRSEDGAYITYKVYPMIYEEEELREIDGVYSETGLGTNEAKSTFISRENSSKTANTSIHPTNTYYVLDNVSLNEKLGAYANLIMPDGADTKYWIASRSIKLVNAGCRYYMRAMYNGALNEPASIMTSSSAEMNTFSIGCPLFPIVTISSGIISSTETQNSFEFTPFN